MREILRSKRKIGGVLLACLLAALLCVPALAADDEGDYPGDFDYRGELDPETGYAQGTDFDTAEKRVSISAGMQYDRETGLFVFAAGNGAELSCSAADGMTVTDKVTLQSSGSLSPTVYRNGKIVDLSSPDALSAPGDYVVYAGSEAGSRLCGFTIIPKTTNHVHNDTVPEGFLIRGATLDAEDTSYSRYYVDLEAEGHYRVSYRCPAAARDYVLDVVIDRTPPEILLSGSVGRDGRVHSAVTISGLREGDSISVTHDGSPEPFTVKDGSGTLTDTGAYSVVVWDGAGNSVSFDFTIMLYLNMNSIIFILMAIAIVASVFIYAAWKRRSLKVR